MVSKRLTFIVIAVLLTTWALGQIKPVQRGYLFRLKFAKGKLYTFLAPTKVSGLSGTPLNLKLKIYAKVLKINHGNTTLKGTIVSPMGFGGKGNSKTKTMVINSRGQLVGSHSSLSGFTVSYPIHPLRKGQSFLSAVPSGIGKSETVIATFKFEGFKTYMGHKVAILAFRCQNKDQPHGMMLISCQDGILDTYTSHFLYQPGTGASLSVFTKISRV